MKQTSGSSQNRGLFLFVVLSTILSCGMAIPLWLVIWIVVTIVKIIKHKPTITIQESTPQPKTIYPSNDFVDDWEYKFYPLESD